MTPTPRYKRIAQLILSRENCTKANNTVWFAKHTEALSEIMQSAPSGRGIDTGTTLAGAEIMRHGYGNPCFSTVAECERYARQAKEAR